jgi:RimJ/RimL family protein N-acetyltransferase
MKFNIDKIQDGLLQFRGLSREALKENNRIFRERYGKEAYYFKMDGLDFITYGKGTEDHVNAEDFQNYFETEFDNEFALELEKYKPYLNEKFTYRLLHENDATLVDEFKKQFSAKDLDMGQVSIEDPVVAGVFDGEKLIAVSSLWYWENDLADIGLIVDTNYRKQGVGRSVVTYIINAVKNEKIMIYRADYDNPGSVRIAESLGFTRVTKVYRYKG